MPPDPSEAELGSEWERPIHNLDVEALRREIQIGIDDVENNRVTFLKDEAALARHMESIWQRAQDRRFSVLREELQQGLDEIERGECDEIADETALAKFFQDVWNEVEQDLANERDSLS